MAKKYTTKSDTASDKKKKIKEDSKQDKKLDKKRKIKTQNLGIKKPRCESTGVLFVGHTR